jgi:hypothetical protein
MVPADAAGAAERYSAEITCPSLITSPLPPLDQPVCDRSFDGSARWMRQSR